MGALSNFRFLHFVFFIVCFCLDLICFLQRGSLKEAHFPARLKWIYLIFSPEKGSTCFPLLVVGSRRDLMLKLLQSAEEAVLLVQALSDLHKRAIPVRSGPAPYYTAQS